MHQCLDLAHVEPVIDDLRRQHLRVVATDQRARMAGCQLALLHQSLHGDRQLQQPQRVGDMAAALADDLGELLLAVVEALDQLAIAGRLLDGVEIRALHVLDDRKLENFLVGEFAHDDRHRVQAGLLRRAPAALAGDDLVAAALRLGRTMIGCTRPLVRIDSASSASSSSRKSLRGLSGLERNLGDRHHALLALGRQRGGQAGAGSPISEARPRPSRLFGAAEFICFVVPCVFDYVVKMRCERADFRRLCTAARAR